MGTREDGRLDRDLVEQAQHGDREAFAILARTHADRLMAIAIRILRDVGRAEDAVQQALVIAWRELPGLRDPDRFDAWLRPPPRQRQLRGGAPLAEMERERPRPPGRRTGGTGRGAVAVDNRDRLERGFRRLPPDQRAILVFTHYLGLTPTEIAERLGSLGGHGPLSTPLRPPGDARGHRGRRAPRRGGRRATPMTDQREIDRVLDAFLAEGTGRSGRPGHRRRPRPDRSHPTAARPAHAAEVLDDDHAHSLAAAAVIGVLAVGGALYLLRPGQPGGGRWSGPGAQCERQPRASPPRPPPRRPPRRRPYPARWP